MLDITDEVNISLRPSSSGAGLCHLFVQHTSCSLIISENSDPGVLLDLKTFMAKLVPENSSYRHSTEGPDDMPAHIRSALTQTSISIPISDGRLNLGTWQAVYLWEHRANGSNRTIILTVSLSSPTSIYWLQPKVTPDRDPSENGS